MLLDAPADISLDAPARAGTMMRFVRTVRRRWRILFLVTGAVLTVLGSCWPAARSSFLASCSCCSPCCMASDPAAARLPTCWPGGPGTGKTEPTGAGRDIPSSRPCLPSYYVRGACRRPQRLGLT